MDENSTLIQRFEQAVSAFDSGDAYSALNELVAFVSRGLSP